VQKIVFQAPGLYADHQVSAVRNQLLCLPGVAEVYASSAFFVVEITYDEAVTNVDSLQSKLDELV
jgi:copper chaperone CopZ